MGEEVVPPGSVVLLGRLYPAPRPPGWCRGDPSWPLRLLEGLGAMADEGAALTVQLTVPPACRGSRHPQAGQCQRVWMAGSWPGPPVRHPGIWELGFVRLFENCFLGPSASQPAWQALGSAVDSGWPWLRQLRRGSRGDWGLHLTRESLRPFLCAGPAARALCTQSPSVLVTT